MKIHNELKQTLSLRDDIVIGSLNVRIRAKRFSSIKKALYRPETLRDFIERSFLKEAIW